MHGASDTGLWVRVTAQGVGKDSWLWRPGTQTTVDPGNTHQLLAEGWQELAEDEDPNQAICLWGQLREVSLLQNAEQGILKLWARVSDLTAVRSLPVALAFSLPEQTHQAIGPLFDTALPPDALLMALNLPPPQLGERALIATQQGWQPLNLGQLDESAHQVQRQIGETVLYLAAPGEWWLWDDLVALCCQSGGYEAKRQELRSAKLATRGRADEQVELQLETLEKARTRASALQRAFARAQGDDPDWGNRYGQLQTLVRKLAELYWNSYQRSRHPTRTLPQIKNIFLTAQAVIPATQTVQAVLAAYSNAASGATAWSQDSPESAPFFAYGKEAGTTVVELRPSESERAPTESAIRSLWNQIRQFTDLDGDVFLAALAQAMAAPTDEEGYTWVTGAQILDYRGIRPMMKQEGAHLRRAGHRQEDVASIAACFSRMRNTWVTLQQLVRESETRGKGRRKRSLYTHESQLIQVSEVIRQHELHSRTSSEAPGPAFEVAWYFRPGTWWRRTFLEVPNRQMAWLCQQVLRYDPLREQWEKRLARYLLFHLRLSAIGVTSSMNCSIGKLLQELSLPVDPRNPQRTRERFEQAMDRLQTDQQIDRWGYAEGNSTLPPRRWLDTWLTWSVRVSVNALASLAYQQAEELATQPQSRGQILESLKQELLE